MKKYFIEQRNKLQTKQGGQLSQLKESKKLQAKDHLVREWAIILASLGTQEIETLESD